MLQNKELELAIQFIEKTDRNLFITGKAGTGKTTFLHKIKSESLKRMVIVAPTGVAAINAKGVTIHSFFQMPFGPILPNQIQKSAATQRKFGRTKIDIIKSLDLVIIDEISMVRADLLDGIDQVLRRYKDRNKVFGGVQILMIGDLQQLAPVVNPSEWNLLKPYYETIYFFSSAAFQQANTISIELKHIYRQENPVFIQILNEIRNNTLSQKSAEILNKRYNPAFTPSKNDGYITLTTHNNRANAINAQELEKLPTKKYSFLADISGKFKEHAYPNSQHLVLKQGAQVLFIKNDSTPEKRYFNGKIGTIVAINSKMVTVQCPNDDFEIETTRETWENITYAINEETKEIKEETAGSFSQIPLRLAWAITIHKSQGLTFEKAIIDAEASFAHGQTYVALSRCTSLEGIVLKTPITKSAIINDKTIDTFNENVAENIPDAIILNASQKEYHLNLISEIFNYYPFLNPINRLMDVYYTNRPSIKGTIIEHLQSIKDKGIVPLMKISASFKAQLEELTRTSADIEKNPAVQERFQKAILYFRKHFKMYIQNPLEEITFSTDNKTVRKELEKHLQILQKLAVAKQYCLTGFTDQFNAKKYLKIRANAVLQEVEKPKKQVINYLGDPVLSVKLRELRSEIAGTENIPHFQIFTQKTLYEICEVLPRTTQQLLQVHGMGKIRVEKYGGEILEIIRLYEKNQKLQVKKA